MIQLNVCQKEAASFLHLSSTLGKTCCYHRDTFLQPQSSSCYTFSSWLCNFSFLSGLKLQHLISWKLNVSWDPLENPCIKDIQINSVSKLPQSWYRLIRFLKKACSGLIMTIYKQCRVWTPPQGVIAICMSVCYSKHSDGGRWANKDTAFQCRDQQQRSLLIDKIQLLQSSVQPMPSHRSINPLLVSVNQSISQVIVPTCWDGENNNAL